MRSSYLIRLFLLTAILAAATITAIMSGLADLPYYTWIGLLFLALVSFVIHKYVQAARENANALIRRLMVASILRMLAAVLFLLITLLNSRPVSIHFVVFYCAYFCAFMVFEISQMRTNLRPDLKHRPKNENA